MKRISILATIAMIGMAMMVSCEKPNPEDPGNPGNGGNGGSSSQMEAVDLGLPSGTKWASMNLGATSVTDPGDYYAWGETSPYYTGQASQPTWKSGKERGYAFESYRFAGTYNAQEDEWTMTKYVTDEDYGTVDGKTVLDPEDDAATAILGNGWRMPTLAEFQELQDRTVSTDTVINGVHCAKLKSRNSANYIIMPYAGVYDETHLENNERMTFWTATCNGNEGAQAGSVSDASLMRMGYFRCVGLVVRPVK